MGTFDITLGNVLASLKGNKDRNLHFHTDHKASVAYLQALADIGADFTFQGSEVIAPGIMTISRLEAETDGDTRIAGFCIPKFAYPLVVGDSGTRVVFNMEKIMQDISELRLPSLDTLTYHSISAKTAPLGAKDPLSIEFERALDEIVEKVVTELRTDATKNTKSHAARIKEIIRRDVTENATMITTDNASAPNLLISSGSLPRDYQGLDVIAFLNAERKVSLGEYEPGTLIKTGRPFQRSEAIILDESYADLAGAYPIARQHHNKPIITVPFDITSDTLDNFCNSINLSRAAYDAKNEGRLSPIVAAYIAVDPLLKYSEETFSDADGIKNAQTKATGLQGKDVQVTKIYVGQTFLANISVDAPPTGEYKVLVGLSEPVRGRGRAENYFEDIRLGYLILTPENKAYAIGESKVRRIYTLKKE